MRIKQILGAAKDGSEARIDFAHNDNSRDTMFMTADVAAELLSGLLDVAWRLQRSGHGFHRGAIYDLAGCDVIATEDQQQGIAFRMRQGFDIAMLLTPEVVSILKSCIERIESGKPDGHVH